MMCSQCQIGRAWDAKGRCRPCSIGNVNLGAPGTSAPPAQIAPPPANLSLTPAPEAPAVPVMAAKPPVACSQCWIGVAWDDEGRCRPCSDGGVRLAPSAPEPEPVPEPEVSPVSRARRWFGERRASGNPPSV
ncbi:MULTISPECIES: hypothetical protein [Streptomyces]|uniref:hypothetical protein n=1 Tax=Streptomyces TaxID=1883 RepID=UPI000CD4D2E5|nr:MULTISPECIES: hypothetical protein [Streptomyces]